MFNNLDFSDFWKSSDYAESLCDKSLLTDDLISEVELELGYRLPASYIWLMKQHNGGIPKNCAFPTSTPTCWSEDHIMIDIIFSIGKEKNYSLCGPHGSLDAIDMWEYPPIGVAICSTPTAGHDMIFLDYRECGRLGEPTVVHIDQEDDYKITFLASNFEEFICGLVSEDNFEY